MVVAIVLVFAVGASAQTVSVGVMPVLYDSDGDPVNTSGGVLLRGIYYLDTEGDVPVTYFGDGSFYNPATRMYGGSVYNPTGRAGSYTIPYSFSEVPPTVIPTTVGIPNTGLGGGNSLTTWAILAISALVSVAGVSYISRSRNVA